MLSQWQLQEAKQQFSRVVELARTEGPQVVTKHGDAVVVVVDVQEFRRLRGEHGDFRDFLMGPPYATAELPLDRDRDPGPDIEL